MLKYLFILAPAILLSCHDCKDKLEKLIIEKSVFYMKTFEEDKFNELEYSYSAGLFDGFYEALIILDECQKESCP